MPYPRPVGIPTGRSYRRALVENAGVFTRLPSGETDPSLIPVAADEVDSATLRFIEAIARHRHFDRYADPPPI